MKTHHLKIKSEYFNLVTSGVKKFEIRKNDRNFKVGDLVYLDEVNKENKLTGSMIGPYLIKYIFQGGEYGLDPEYVIFNW